MIRQRLSHHLIFILWILMLVGCAVPATPDSYNHGYRASIARWHRSMAS